MSENLEKEELVEEETEEVVEKEEVETPSPAPEENDASTEVEPAPEAPTPEEEAPTAEEEVQEEKWLSQSRVNELVGRARQEGRDSALKELFSRYGVGQETEMDEVFGKGQAYDSLNDEYLGVNNSYREVMAENALLKSQIDANRWDDVKLILGGKGLDITAENISSMLATHPEWKSTPQVEENITPVEKPVVIRKLGGDVSPQQDEISEEEKFNKLFGFSR